MTAPVDLQPTLIGATLQLRPTVAGDFDAMFAAASDPLIWAVHPAHDRWQEPVFRAYFADALESGGGMTVIERASGEIVGASRYSAARAGPGEVEIGWTFLVRRLWGGGANHELKSLMLGHAWQWFDPVIFMVGENNVRSRGAMEKIGGVLRPGTVAVASFGAAGAHVIFDMPAAAGIAPR